MSSPEFRSSSDRPQNLEGTGSTRSHDAMKKEGLARIPAASVPGEPQHRGEMGTQPGRANKARSIYAGSMQKFAELREELAGSHHQTLQAKAEWNDRLFATREEVKAQVKGISRFSLKASRRAERAEGKQLMRDMRELGRAMEYQRIDYSSGLYNDRYIQEIQTGTVDDPILQAFPKHQRKAFFFLRSEPHRVVKRYHNDEHGNITEAFHTAPYRNYYNPKTGVFIAAENWRNTDEAKLPTEPSHPDSGSPPNSEITINMMRTCVERIGGDPRHLPLNCIIQHTIGNEQTLGVIRELVQPGETKRFVANSPIGRKLLETPNGKSSHFLSRQYFHISGGRKIERVEIKRFEDQHFGYGDTANMSIYFKPAGSQMLRKMPEILQDLYEIRMGDHKDGQWYDIGREERDGEEPLSLQFPDEKS